jgi:hypothetical protein
VRLDFIDRNPPVIRSGGDRFIQFVNARYEKVP